MLVKWLGHVMVVGRQLNVMNTLCAQTVASEATEYWHCVLIVSAKLYSLAIKHKELGLMG